MSRRVATPVPDLDTRVRLLEAGMAMFARYGFESTTLKELAAGVGATTGAVYSSFESKRDLFASAVVYAREIVESAVIAAQPKRGSMDDRAAAYLRALADLAADKPDLMAFRVIVPQELGRNDGLRIALDDELRSRAELCERVLSRGHDGSKSRLTAQARDRASVILAMGEGLCAMLQSDPRVPQMAPARALPFLLKLLSGELLEA